MAQQTFDPKLVVLNFAGVTFVQLAKGTFIEVDYDSDAFSDDVAATGEVVRIASADLRGTVKATLDMGSPTNDALSNLAITDRLTGLATGPMLLKDVRGTSLFTAATAWIKKIPAKPFATENAHNVWEIRCAVLRAFVGGLVAI